MLSVPDPYIAEEVLHHDRALFFEDAAFEFDLVVVTVFYIEDVVAGTDGAALGFIGSEIYLADTALDYGTGAHGAGFQCDIHVAIVKPEVSDLAAGLIYCYYFRMGYGIATGKP